MKLTDEQRRIANGLLHQAATFYKEIKNLPESDRFTIGAALMAMILEADSQDKLDRVKFLAQSLILKLIGMPGQFPEITDSERNDARNASSPWGQQ